MAATVPKAASTSRQVVTLDEVPMISMSMSTRHSALLGCGALVLTEGLCSNLNKIMCVTSDCQG